MWAWAGVKDRRDTTDPEPVGLIGPSVSRRRARRSSARDKGCGYDVTRIRLVQRVREPSISSREDGKTASSAMVEISAEVDSLCDSADEESCKFYSILSNVNKQLFAEA